MRLFVTLLAVAATAEALSRSQRRANYDALPDEKIDPNFELLFATSLWRHGDRAAANAIAGCDLFTEDDWTIGGGGYGELSPEGMRQHFELGRKLRKRYVDDFKILSPAYTAKEVYFRSTDLNRTLVSAYANAAGMYSGFGVEGQNYPSQVDLPGWPTGYVPIPVHTVPYNTDHELHPDADCDRLQQLYDLVNNSPEYLAYCQEPQVAQVLKYLSDESGIDVNPNSLYNFYDPMYCEANHIEELNQTGARIEDFYPWFYTGEIPAMVDSIQAADDDFSEGDGNPNGINGVDVSVEIPKIHAGDTLKLIASNVHGILACRDTPDADGCRKFYKKLKYYAMSAHDSTVESLLTIFGVRKYAIPDLAVPAYSSTVLVEVYEDRTTGEKSFKVFYHADENSGFKPITGFVRGCDVTKDTCKISVLDDLVAKYSAEDLETLCNTPLNATPVETAPPAPELTTQTETTSVKPTSTTTKQTTTTSSSSSSSLLAAICVILLTFL